MSAGIKTKFLQTVHLACDDQGRITLPSHIRTAMAELGTSSIVVGRLKPFCLTGYNEFAYDEIINSLNESHSDPFTSLFKKEEDEKDKIRRFVFANFAMCIPDKQGRINIPPKIRESVGILPGNKITIAGLGDHLEIWPYERFDQEEQKCTNQLFGNGVPLSKESDETAEQ
jgi:MraZ protein